MSEQVLDDARWQARARAYRERLDGFLVPHLRRIAAGDPAPEFLFSYYGLRPGQLDATPLRCTHFDAFRFFTTAAAPRNSGALSHATQADWVQPGCLQLAAAAREVDMRASPYDPTGYGYAPIAIEAPAGRAEYVRCQSAIAERAVPLRAVLLERCDLLLRVAECG